MTVNQAALLPLLGQYAQSSARSLSPLGLQGSLAQALNSPLFGQISRSGALSLSPQGISLAAALAMAPRFGLSSARSVAKHIGPNGIAETYSRSTPLSQETLAAVKSHNIIALAAARSTPFGSKARAIALTPFGILVSGASSGLYGQDSFRALV
jgi:hypothetical protein